MSEKNTTQNMITAISIIVALAALVYAMMVKMDQPKIIEVDEAVKEEVAEKTYEVGAENPVVMTMNGKDITRVEILDNFSKSGMQLPPNVKMEQVFPLMQEQYLVGELIKKAAKEKGIDSENPIVQQKLNAVLEQSIRAAYLEEIGKEKVTDVDIRKAYDDIVGNSETLMERKARHILLDDEAKANALIVKLNQGKDFAKLAEKESKGPTAAKGGELGYFAKGEMVPEFERAAFDLEIGKITQVPVKTQFGYHIIKVEDERERAKPSFETVKEQLANQLRQAVVAETIQGLRDGANITLYDFKGEEIKKEETQAKPAPAEAPAPSPAPTPAPQVKTDDEHMSDKQPVAAE